MPRKRKKKSSTAKIISTTSSEKVGKKNNDVVPVASLSVEDEPIDFGENDLVENFDINFMHTILHEQYAKKFSTQDAIYYPESQKVLAQVFLNNNKRIIVFSVVKDYLFAEDKLTSLDKALDQFKNIFSWKSDDLLIIPVAELVRNHFRLLVVTAAHIVYYDSKSVIASLLARAFAPIIPSVLRAEKETYEAYDDERAVLDEQGSSVAAEVSFFVRAQGFYFFKALKNVFSYTEPVKQACLKHLPSRPFEDKALGHQAFSQHTNCGPLTISYAEKIAEDADPAKKTEDDLLMRGRYYGNS